MSSPFSLLRSVAIAVQFASTLAAGASAESHLARFETVVKPFAREYCVGCHGAKKQEGELRLDALSYDLLKGANREDWHDVLSVLQTGDMPPKGAKVRPTDKELEVVVTLLQNSFEEVVATTESTGGRVVLRRLTQYEYQNTMSDLLGVDLDFTEGLPADEKSRDGFRNNGSTMGMTTAQLMNYVETARRGLNRAIVTGERPKPLVATSKFAKNQLKLYPVKPKNGPPSKDKSKKGGKDGSKYQHGTDIKPGELFPFKEGILRIRVKARGVNDQVQRLGLSLGKEGDKVNELKLVDEIEFRGTKTQEFVFDVQMADFPKPVYALHRGAKLFLLIQAWDANRLSFEESFGYKAAGGASDIVVELIEAEGPIVEQWPPASHARIFFKSPNSNDEDVYAREILSRFMRRAWRRPVSEAEVLAILRQYQTGREFLGFTPAIKEALVSVLASPHFLYLTEPVQKNTPKQPLTNHELASRLSYFLWSTMPDERLSQLADNGQLSDPKVLKRVANEMIRDDRAKNFVEHFALQWLNLDLLVNIAVNPEYYPKYDERITHDMKQETLLFFEELLKSDLSVLNVLDSDFTFLNRRLARHYGIPYPKTERFGFVRVALNNQPQRGGVLTHGSVHLVGSDGEDSHAIRRGTWVLDRLLASPPPPPPPNVPQLDNDPPELASLPLKERLAQHATNQACARCHRKIDPFGVAFENYDATGAWREEKFIITKSGRKNRRTVVVDSKTELPDGTKIDGVADLKAYLLTQKKEEFAEGFVRRLLTYALGRSLEITDTPTVRSLTSQFQKQDYRMSALITAIVQSDPFQTK